MVIINVINLLYDRSGWWVNNINTGVIKERFKMSVSDAKRVGRTGLIADYGVAAILEVNASIVWTMYPEAYM